MTSGGLPVVQPSHYDVDLEFSGLYESDKINDNFYFNGSSAVDFTVNEDICSFHLHIRGVYEIQNVHLTVEGISMGVTFVRNTDYEYLTIFPDMQVKTGANVRAIVHFRVQMPTGTSGLYLAHYTNQEKGTKFRL